MSAVVTAIACLVLGGTSVVANYADYQRYKAGGEQFTRYASALAAAIAISAERGPANSLMGAADDNKKTELVAALQAKRAETDRSLKFMEAHFADEIGAANLLRARLAKLKVELSIARSLVNAVAAKPFKQRTGRQVADAIETMFAVADVAIELRDQLGPSVISITPQAATEVILSSMAGTMREQAGRLGSYVVMMLTSDMQDDSFYLAKFEYTLARLSELRGPLDGYAGAFFVTPEIDDKIKEVERSFFDGAMLYAKAVARINGSGNDITAAEFTREYVPGMRPTEELWRLIAKTSGEAMAQRRETAFELVMVSAAITGLAIIVLAAVAAIFRNFLFRPLLTARRQIMAIAHGDLSEPGNVQHVSREIRDMFEGLEILRNGQVSKRELELERLHMAEQLKRLSETDALTGLANRRMLDQTASGFFDSPELRLKALGMVIFDIDHFKTINDTYGHVIGDVVLQKVATELGAMMRHGDIFARYGGEEFVVLMPGVNMGELTRFAERLRCTMEKLAVDDGLELDVSASFGVALRPPGVDLTWDRLVAMADRRLYLAKQAGRNLVCASDELPVRLEPRQSSAA